MPRENYRRIVKGYEPIEPAGFFEKVFYLLWLSGYVFQIILMRVRRYRTRVARIDNEPRYDKYYWKSLSGDGDVA